MWWPPINFITLHYAWVIFMGLLSFVILLPYGNLKAIDAYFFGVSASTESGLNTVDIHILPFYQQFYIYVTPIITSLGFVNIFAVVARLYWFEKKLGRIESSLKNPGQDVEAGQILGSSGLETQSRRWLGQGKLNEKAAYSEDDEKAKGGLNGANRRKPFSLLNTQTRKSAQNKTESMFVSEEISSKGSPYQSRIPSLSRFIGFGRKSSMNKLDREELGGIEYRSLKLLLKIVAGYFIGIHLLGIISLLPWIHRAPAKYQDHLAATGVDKTWWAFYSSQTMISNLGLTLTPDSMITFQDTTWPLLIMTFLTYAGNTLYPVFLRLLIWVLAKLSPPASHTRASLTFLLENPRRCYTLLFPSKPTWILLGINLVINIVDVILIIVLDLSNPELTHLSPGARVVCAIFQAGSSRHTGSSTLNLANVNPAVQFSLLVMMYIAALPLATTVRGTEEKSLGLYKREEECDEGSVRAYLVSHLGNQLDFDLWWIFLGTFLVVGAEAGRVGDLGDPAFSVFSILFEVVSAYCNVGLSLGHPATTTSLAGEFTTISKLIICATMIRGRHRCLPYALDKNVVLPGEVGDESTPRIEG